MKRLLTAVAISIACRQRKRRRAGRRNEAATSFKKCGPCHDSTGPTAKNKGWSVLNGLNDGRKSERWLPILIPARTRIPASCEAWGQISISSAEAT
jgi:hypothetical protein